MADSVKWSSGRRSDFIAFIREELWRVKGLRQPLEQKWRDWLEVYRAPFDKRSVKDFPYPGASNLTYPFAMMSVNPILANEMQVLHAGTNLWTLAPLNAQWVNTAKPLQDYLAFVDRHVLHMWSVNKKALLEKLKLGTAIYKVGWEFRRTRTTGYDSTLTRTRFVRTLNRPVVDHVPLANFFIPPEANAIDPDAPMGAQWIAERQRVRPSVLRAKARGQDPFLPNYDKDATERVLHFAESAVTEHAEKVRDLERIGSAPSAREPEIELYEVHARFDTTGDGIEDDVVVTLHVDSGEILQALYQPYAHGKRPYHKVGFIPGDGFYDIGVCEMAEIWQSAISEMLNTSIDKARLTNAPMLSIKEGANVLPGEPVYPTKVWPRNEADDIQPLFLTDGRGNFDFAQLIGFLQNGGNEHVGVSSLRRGAVSDLPSRTPATTIQSMLAESNTLFDLSVKDERKEGLSRVGLQVLQLIQQMEGRPEMGGEYIQLAAMVLGENGQFVAEALQLPFEDIAVGIGVELTATSGSSNKAMEQQKLMGLLQLGSQLAPAIIQFTQLAEQAQGSATGATALGAAQGLIELYRRLLEQHDIRGINDILPEEGVAALLKTQANPALAAQPAQGGGGPGGAQGAGGPAQGAPQGF